MTADLIGWTGSVAFAVCGIPQAWECFKRKTARGISPAFVGLWLIGEVCYVISVLMKFGWVSWMMFNYTANIFSIAINIKICMNEMITHINNVLPWNGLTFFFCFL